MLNFPEVPLENNRAARDLREVVVKRKISPGPRTPDGVQAWEVFFTVLTTCTKQGAYQLPPLTDLVRAHAAPT